MRSMGQGSHGGRKASTQRLAGGAKPVREIAKECPVGEGDLCVKSSKPKKDSSQLMGATGRSKEICKREDHSTG